MRIINVLLLFCSFCLFGCADKPADKPSTLHIDYAYYNPVSLLLKDKGWLEQDLAKDGVKVEWLLSLGSNKALELLNSESVDFGSTAGAAALIGKANGNPIRSVYVYSKPEWTALVTRSDSPIQTVNDLKGKKVAATRGTDPHIFLLRALDRFGLSERDIELVPLQHSDGKNALLRGDVDAWAGLDPYMAQAELEQGARLFFRDPELNSFGVLNVRASFAEKYPAYVERVLGAYEKARQYALAHPEDVAAVLARDAKLSVEVARRELERTNFASSAIGAPQREVMLAAGGVLGKAGVIKADVDVGATVSSLIEPRFVQRVLGR
jgi:sulfonate transport system substrate-binding protein